MGLRPRHAVSVGLATTVLVAATAGVVVFGAGLGAPAFTLADQTAWLANTSIGTVTRVNGLSAQPDAVVPVAAGGGRQFDLSQSGPVVLVTDPATGVAGRVDPALLTIAGTRRVGPPGVRLLVGTGGAYAVDGAQGSVVRLDPVTLEPLEDPVVIHDSFGDSALAPDGTVWLALDGRGELLPVGNGGAGEPVPVAPPGHRLEVVMSAGSPVAVDVTDRAVIAVRDGDAQPAVRLPGVAAEGVRLLVTQEAVDGRLVVVVPANRSLHVADLHDREVRTINIVPGVTLGGMGNPVLAGDTVIVPEEADTRSRSAAWL